MPGKYPYVLTRDFHLTDAQLFKPITREGILFWAISHTFGPWVVLPPDIPYNAVLSVSSKNLIEDKKVMIRVVGLNRMRYVVRQPDLVRAIDISDKRYFDAPHSLLTSITCSIMGCMAPVQFTFEERKVCALLDSSGVDEVTTVFLRRLLQGVRVPLHEIDLPIQRIIERSQFPDRSMALVARVLEVSAMSERC